MGGGVRRALRGGTLLVALSLLAACDSPAGPVEEPGYDFTLPLDQPAVYRWPGGARIGVYVHGGIGATRGRLLAEAVRAAAADWQAALGPDAVDFTWAPGPEGAEVVVRWSDVAPPVDAASCPPLVTGRAATTFCRGAEGRLLRFASRADGTPTEVRMLVTVLASEATSPARVRQLVAHELGHVLGIGRHSPDPDDLMWGGPLTALSPSAADRATLQRLYRTEPDLIP